MPWWFSHSSAGLDIGTDTIKWSAVESSRLRSYLLSAPFLERRVARYQELENKQVEQRLATLLRDWKGKAPVWPKTLAVSVQGRGVMSGYLEFPQLSKRELETALPATIAREVPFPMDHTATVSERVAPLGAVSGTGIFYTVMQRWKFSYINQLLGAAGLEPTHIEPAALALKREFVRNHDVKPEDKEFVALIDCGYRWTQIVVQRGGNCYYARDFELAGGHFTASLAKAYNLAWPDAEQRKFQLDVSREFDDAVEPSLRRWLETVRLHVLNFESRSAHRISRIYLSGGSAAWPGLQKRLQDHLLIDVLSDDWKKIHAPADCQGNAVIYKVALGLALQKE